MPGFVDLPVADLARATRLLGEKDLELAIQGYHPRLRESGLNRAWGMADFHTRALSARLRGEAFVETLIAELAEVKGWIDKHVAGIAR